MERSREDRRRVTRDTEEGDRELSWVAQESRGDLATECHWRLPGPLQGSRQWERGLFPFLSFCISSSFIINLFGKGLFCYCPQSGQPQVTPPTSDTLLCPQNDREKALKAMEMTWNNMEKKEKLMWIKKAAEDQKRYEVGKGLLVSSVGQDGARATSSHLKLRNILSGGWLSLLRGTWSQKSRLGLCDPE